MIRTSKGEFMTVELIRKLRADINTFSADSASLIQQYWPQTQMKIGLVFVMMTIRDRLENESNPKLNNAFKQIKRDFVDYLSKKIDGKATSENDDLLFEIREVASLQLNEADSVVIEDIKKSNLSSQLKISLIAAFQRHSYQDALRMVSEL